MKNTARYVFLGLLEGIVVGALVLGTFFLGMEAVKLVLRDYAGPQQTIVTAIG